MKKATAGLIALGAVIAMSGVAEAHHSFVAFDNRPGREVTIEGVVTRWQWTNPHAFLEVRVTGANGRSAVWVMEGPSTVYMTRRGWTKRSLNPGDRVTVTLAPLRNGQPGGLLQGASVNGTRLPAFDVNPGRSETPPAAPRS